MRSHHHHHHHHQHGYSVISVSVLLDDCCTEDINEKTVSAFWIHPAYIRTNQLQLFAIGNSSAHVVNI